MKRTRRITSAIAAAGMAAALLAGCGGGSSDSTTSKPITLGFVPGITSDPFFIAMHLGAEKEAKKLGIKLDWQGSSTDYSPETQIPFVDGVLAKGVDALLISATNPDGMQASVNKALAQGIPVIAVDESVTDMSKVTSFITGSNVLGGEIAAKELFKEMGEKGKVFLSQSSPTDPTNVGRAKGFMTELKKHPGIEFVGVEYHNSQASRAQSIVQTQLLKHPDLGGIFAINGTAVTGAVAALRNGNAAGKVKLVGYDAYPEEVAALKAGFVTALIAQKPAEEAAIAVRYAYAAVTKKDVGSIKKNVVLPNTVMTKANLAETGQFEYATK